MIQKHLVDEIKKGRCVAFVGAGFSMPDSPNWLDLIKRLIEHAPKESQGLLCELIKDFNNNNPVGLVNFEVAAQLIKDTFADETQFVEALKKILSASTSDGISKTVNERLRNLQRIPFKAILTTNFDQVLKGHLPSREIYGKILRAENKNWTTKHRASTVDYGSLLDSENTIILKMHGDIGNYADPNGIPVFTSEDYNERLFSNSSYQNFLKALMSTHTMLFLGFSFSDPYLNLIRREILTQTGGGRGANPIAYALVPDIDDGLINGLKKYDGVYVHSYDSDNGHDHSKFDDFLFELGDATDPENLAPNLTKGKHILWIDPTPENNTFAIKNIGEGNVKTVSSVEEALKHLKTTSPIADLIISNWGHNAVFDSANNMISSGRHLMTLLSVESIEVPVIFFASADHYVQNRREAVALGAYEYTCTFSGLLGEVEKLFSDLIQ